MDACQFYLLGPPHLICNDQPLSIARRKQWGLLTYLLLTRQPHERDALAALFWPTCSQAHARADLRRELARLRSLLPDLLLCRCTEVALRTEPPLWVDVWAFAQHLAAVQTHDHPSGIYCAACLEHLRAARALYTGDLLAGYTLAASPAFEEWHFFQQESLRSQLLEVLSNLAALEMAGANLAQAIPPLRQRLAIDPLHEESHRQLIWLYTHTGQRTAALRQFAECKEALARDLGIDPAPETIALYRQIAAFVAAPAPPIPARDREQPRLSPSPSHQASPPSCFVGRERCLAQLHVHLATACRSRGRVVFVTGEAGAGKTALLDHFARQAMASHTELIVASGCGTAPYGADAPLLPFRDLLAMLAGDFGGGLAESTPSDEQVLRLRAFFPHVLHALVTTGPHLVDSLLAGDSLLARAADTYLGATEDYTRLRALVTSHHAGVVEPESHHLIFAEVAALLQALAAQCPLLLLLDNLHWADALSLNLLFHLGKRLGTQPILIVGAYRPDEIAVDDSVSPHADGLLHHHPLLALTHEFMRDFGAVQVDLDAEVPDEDLAWLDALLAAESCQLSPALRATLFAQTHGHPLYTTELLDLWRAQGWLCRRVDGIWIEQHSPDLCMVPSKVAAAIQRRLDRLSDDALRLLLVASVAGETFTLPALTAAQGWSERRTLELLATELHHRHHLVAEVVPQAASEVVPEIATEATTGDGSPPARYRFANPMLRTYLYSQLDDSERRLLASMHAELGTQIGTLGGRVSSILKSGMVAGQATLTQSYQPICPLAEIARSQGSVPMYHRWHLNHPLLILILGILLVAWLVTYTLTTTPGFRLSDLWQQAPQAERAAAVTMIEVAPGFNVPRDYYMQEKLYREPAIVTLSSGFVVPQGYYIQEKTYREPAFVEVAPGFKVPQGYYIQEKMYREPAFVEVAPGFKVPEGYYIQEKMYREETSPQ